MPKHISPSAQLLIREFLHQVRNPMSSVLTLATLLGDAKSLDSGEATKMAGLLDAETRRMNETLIALDKFIRLPDVVLEDVNLSQIVQNALDNKSTFEGKEITIKNTLPASLPVRADAVQLENVLTLIFENSVKALAKIMGDDAVLELDSIQESEEIIVRIHDNGPGFENEETIRRALEPFYSTDPEAAGMGLATANAIMQNHGGAITIDLTAKNGGASVRLHFAAGEK